MTSDLRALIDGLADEPKVMTLEHDRLILRRKDDGTDARVVLVRCPHTIGLCFETDTPEPGWLALLPCPCNDRSEVIADLVPRTPSNPAPAADGGEAEAAEALLACSCGHGLDEHNGLGCYARLSYEPLVKCECGLTDDRTYADMLAPHLADLRRTERAEGAR